MKIQGELAIASSLFTLNTCTDGKLNYRELVQTILKSYVGNCLNSDTEVQLIFDTERDRHPFTRIELLLFESIVGISPEGNLDTTWKLFDWGYRENAKREL